MISLLVRIGCRSDLKPENILLMEDGTVRLCDFGACYQVGIPGMYVRLTTIAVVHTHERVRTHAMHQDIVTYIRTYIHTYIHDTRVHEQAVALVRRHIFTYNAMFERAPCDVPVCVCGSGLTSSAVRSRHAMSSKLARRHTTQARPSTG